MTDRTEGPAPWKAVQTDYIETAWHIVEEGTDFVVAEVNARCEPDGRYGYEEAGRHAALIADAAETARQRDLLLAVLKELHEECQSFGGTGHTSLEERVEAAIAECGAAE